MSRVHAIMKDFMISGHLTKLLGPFKAQRSALTRNVARFPFGLLTPPRLREGPPGLATLLVGLRDSQLDREVKMGLLIMIIFSNCLLEE